MENIFKTPTGKMLPPAGESVVKFSRMCFLFVFFTKITFEGKNRECHVFSKFILLFENSPLNYNARFKKFYLDYEMAK